MAPQGVRVRTTRFAIMAVLTLLAGVLAEAAFAHAAPAFRLALLADAAGPAAAPQAVVSGARAADFRALATDAAVPFSRSTGRWLRVTLASDWSAASPPLLVLRGARFNTVEVYAPPGYRPVPLALTRPASDPRFSRGSLVRELPADLRAGQPVYLYLPPSPNPARLSVAVDALTHYLVRDLRHVRLIALLTSVQFTMVLVGLTLWAALRERLYGYFLGYITPQMVYLLIVSGELYELPGTDLAGRIGIRALWIAAAVSAPFALSFILAFCDLRRMTPRLARLLAALRWPFALLALTAALLPMAWIQRWQADAGNALFVLSSLTAIVAVALAWRRGSVEAGVFLLAWIPQSMLTALVAALLVLRQPLPAWLEYGHLATLAFSSLVLTVGLGLSTLRARRERDQAHRLAEHDALTGAYNRRALLARLAAALIDARQSAQPLSLLFLDLDHFKDVNDRSGHEAGDALLRELTARWSAQLRRSDLLGRYGGDEFVLCLPDTDAAGSAEILARLETSHPFRWSVGTATAVEGDTLSTMLSRADAALYEQKRSSRAG